MDEMRLDDIEPVQPIDTGPKAAVAPVVDVISFDGKVERSGGGGTTIWVNGRAVFTGDRTVEGIKIQSKRGTSAETRFVLPPSDAGETDFSLKVGQKIAVQSGKVLEPYEQRAAEDAESVFDEEPTDEAEPPAAEDERFGDASRPEEADSHGGAGFHRERRHSSGQASETRLTSGTRPPRALSREGRSYSRRTAMNIHTPGPHRQSGAALIALLALVILVSAAVLLENLEDGASASVARNKASSTALTDAKTALIAWSTAYTPSAARDGTVGMLPYPDRNGDGNYDGLADCDPLGSSDVALVGRLPRRGEDATSCGIDNPLFVDMKDGSRGSPCGMPCPATCCPARASTADPSTRTWAVRAGWPTRGSGWWTPRATPSTIPIPGQPLAVAAVIFAPGGAVANQDRAGAAAPSNYLDALCRWPARCTTTQTRTAARTPPARPASATSARSSSSYPNPDYGDEFNDQIAYITVDELMRTVEKRVLGETALALDAYRGAGWNTDGVYPWLAPFRSPRSMSSGVATAGSSTSMIRRPRQLHRGRRGGRRHHRQPDRRQQWPHYIGGTHGNRVRCAAGRRPERLRYRRELRAAARLQDRRRNPRRTDPRAPSQRDIQDELHGQLGRERHRYL